MAAHDVAAKPSQRVIYRDETNAEVIGYIARGGCENPACLRACVEGREWHATPAGFAVTLDTYHYDTAAQAEAAIRGAMQNIAGRTVGLSVGEDHAWRAGATGADGYPTHDPEVDAQGRPLYRSSPYA